MELCYDRGGGVDEGCTPSKILKGVFVKYLLSAYSEDLSSVSRGFE
jgi:hypothetical protein